MINFASTLMKTSFQNVQDLKAHIFSLGINIVGVAELSKLSNIPAGLSIDLTKFFKRYPYAIVIGAQFGKPGKGASGDETALYLEKIAMMSWNILRKKDINI